MGSVSEGSHLVDQYASSRSVGINSSFTRTSELLYWSVSQDAKNAVVFRQQGLRGLVRLREIEGRVVPETF